MTMNKIEAEVKQFIDQFIKAGTDVIAAETLRDPNLAKQSEEYQRGYADGVRVITEVISQMVIDGDLLVKP